MGNTPHASHCTPACTAVDVVASAEAPTSSPAEASPSEPPRRSSPSAPDPDPSTVVRRFDRAPKPVDWPPAPSERPDGSDLISRANRRSAPACASITSAGSAYAALARRVCSPPTAPVRVDSPPAAPTATRRTMRGGVPSVPARTSKDICPPSARLATSDGRTGAPAPAPAAPSNSFTTREMCSAPTAPAGTLTLAVWKPPGRGRWGDGFESGCDAGGGASGARCTMWSVSPSSTRRSERRCSSERTRPRQMSRWRAAGTAETRSSMTLRSGTRICARRGKEVEGG